jgi:hypothetical protein
MDPLGSGFGMHNSCIPAAIVPIPLALATIGIVIIGVPFTDALPVFLAALVSYSITHGLGLGGNKELSSNKEV